MTTITCEYPGIQKVIDELPITLVSSEEFGSDYPLIVQRFIADAARFTMKPLPLTALAVHMGGKTTRSDAWSETAPGIFPSAAILIPARLKTEWTYSGQVEFSVFFFPENGAEELRVLNTACAALGAPVAVFNRLLSALTEEFCVVGPEGVDKPYLDRLVPVLVEQCTRELVVGEGGAQVTRDLHMNRIHAVLKHMRHNLHEPEQSSDYAKMCGVSTPHFRRLFKEATGLSVHQYVLQLRLEKARLLLTHSRMSLGYIQDVCGFGSASAFGQAFKKRYDVTPSEMRKQFRAH